MHNYISKYLLGNSFLLLGLCCHIVTITTATTNFLGNLNVTYTSVFHEGKIYSLQFKITVTLAICTDIKEFKIKD